MKNIQLQNRVREWMMGCLDCCENLVNGQLSFVVKDQLIRSSTSTYANLRAVRLAQTRASFVAKLSIVIEESDEALGWLELIRDRNLSKLSTQKLIKEGNELVSIFIASRKTTQRNMKA